MRQVGRAIPTAGQEAGRRRRMPALPGGGTEGCPEVPSSLVRPPLAHRRGDRRWLASRRRWRCRRQGQFGAGRPDRVRARGGRHRSTEDEVRSRRSMARSPTRPAVGAGSGRRGRGFAPVGADGSSAGALHPDGVIRTPASAGDSSGRLSGRSALGRRASGMSGGVGACTKRWWRPTPLWAGPVIGRRRGEGVRSRPGRRWRKWDRRPLRTWGPGVPQAHPPSPSMAAAVAGPKRRLRRRDLAPDRGWPPPGRPRPPPRAAQAARAPTLGR